LAAGGLSARDVTWQNGALCDPDGGPPGLLVVCGDDASLAQDGLAVLAALSAPGWVPYVVALPDFAPLVLQWSPRRFLHRQTDLIDALDEMLQAAGLPQ